MDGDRESDEDDVATEHWDDEGGHLASSTQHDDDAGPARAAKTSMDASRSRSPRRIAHFPPLRASPR
ncbi:hypothetical protein CH252_18455 [Rhodococcus sp. 06-1477-1B]|nr:hypothetical protein CH252_18455 [Rhodococcus sp. 06-1477-1B]